MTTEPEPKKYIVNLSAERIHKYPAWEECNIDDADDTAIVGEASLADFADFSFCVICDTKPR